LLATYLEIKVPTDHQVASPLKILAEFGGRHSRKTAASTGRFPPTPRPKQAYSAQTLNWVSARSFMFWALEETYPTQLGAPPAARPNAPQIHSVMLKAGRRPMASEAIPQKEAPMIKPTKRAHVANREWLSEIPNSLAIGVSVRATPYIQLVVTFNLNLIIRIIPVTTG